MGPLFPALRRAPRWRRRTLRYVVVLALAGACGLASAPLAEAQQDTSGPKHDLAASPDFRVRVSAALALGRSHDATARAALEAALGDTNPAVRTAAAAALGALGDGAAVAALERQKARETSDSAKAQMEVTIAALKKITTLQGVSVVVQIGTMRNLTQTRGADVAHVLRGATTTRTRAMSSVAVAMPADSALLARAASQHVPVVVLDGTVTKLTQARSGTNVTCQAEVEFIVRKVPEQTLRSTLSGAATSMGSGTTSVAGVTHLQDQAVDGAVESALRHADQGLLLAAR